MTNTEQKLSEIHSKLMSQNISLHSQLTQPGEQATPSRESHDSASSKQTTPPPVHEHTRGASRTLRAHLKFVFIVSGFENNFYVLVLCKCP